MKSHKEFLKEVEKAQSIPEKTKDALNVKEVSEWEVLWEVVLQEFPLTRE